MKFPYEPMEVKEQCSVEGITYFMVQTKSSRDGWEVADIRPDIPNQRKAADLFAAAPDLLEAAQLALQIAESWIHDKLDGTSSIDGALLHLDPVRAAIARARGEA